MTLKRPDFSSRFFQIALMIFENVGIINFGHFLLPQPQICLIFDTESHLCNRFLNSSKFAMKSRHIQSGVFEAPALPLSSFGTAPLLNCPMMDLRQACQC